MLTTAVFAVVITAPLGAIMINTLGTKWLQYDGEDPELLEKHGLKAPKKSDDEQVGGDEDQALEVEDIHGEHKAATPAP